MLVDRRKLILSAAASMPIIAMTDVAAAEVAGGNGPDLAGVRSAGAFAGLVIPRATLSIAASKMAVRRLQRADALEFAGFELEEAIAVTKVLNDLGVPTPEITGEAQAALEGIQSAADGLPFDRAYMKAQYENHAFLARLAASYLSQSDPNPTDEGEKHGRHLATIALFAFNEHTAITKRISHELHA